MIKINAIKILWVKETMKVTTDRKIIAIAIPFFLDNLSKMGPETKHPIRKPPYPAAITIPTRLKDKFSSIERNKGNIERTIHNPSSETMKNISTNHTNLFLKVSLKSCNGNFSGIL